MNNDLLHKACELHGTTLAHCPICHKNDGECDYGSCTDAHSFTTNDNRSVCLRHARVLLGLGRG